MKPYKIIENQKKVIDNLTYKLQYSKNKEKDVAEINTLIKTLKSFDSMLTNKYYTDALNTLILALIYELLMFYKAYENEIPLKTIFDTIKTDLHYGKELKKQQIISILKHHEMQNKIKNNSVFDENYINFDELIETFTNEIKQNIQWNMKK